MKEIFRYGLVLALICMIAAGLLATVNSFTKAKILAQGQKEEEVGLREVMPEAFQFEPIKSQTGEILYYKASDKEGRPVGIVFKAEGKGYSSTITTLVGMRDDFSISAIKILSQNETPGLGARVSEEDFAGQFKNKKDLNDVCAITGATISSKAVIEAVKKKVEEIKGLIKQ
ncbi:MAG: FMN-binding protein [Candidatus Omnitrophica bacterium]|nr:FMN-binding protein [Candidatus Omnitrophota bacterium]